MSGHKPTLKSIADAATANRPLYFDDKTTDELLAILLELAEENCVLRDRLKSAEHLHAGLSELIDQHQPDAAETSDRLSAHSEYVNALMERVARLMGKS